MPDDPKPNRARQIKRRLRELRAEMTPRKEEMKTLKAELAGLKASGTPDAADDEAGDDE